MNANRMHQFTQIARAGAKKRDAQERNQDFSESYDLMVETKAQEQSGRCEQCGVPFCQTYCPLSNNIPDWLQMAAEERWQEGYELAASTNIFPEICGRICPQDRLCEGGCVLEQSEHGSVTIGNVETFLTEKAWSNNWIKPIVAPRISHFGKIAVIGSGPAGLASAVRLRQKGHAVTVFEKADRAGGLLIYGIPPFKLAKSVVNRRIQWMEDSGIVFALNTEIGRDISFAQLEETFDAVVVATGAQRSRTLDVGGDVYGKTPDENKPDINAPQGIVRATEFLSRSNRIDLNDITEQQHLHLSARNRVVTVIGGGDTAMDCVRTAIRQGAREVVCLYRRDQANMPGSAREVLMAQEEGVTFNWLTAPEQFSFNHDNSAVTGVHLRKMRLTKPDQSLRSAAEPIAGPCAIKEADLVILALGYETENIAEQFELSDLGITRWGTIEADPNGATTLPTVFAGGDIVRGPSLVVWAIRDGIACAESIDTYLSAQDRSKQPKQQSPHQQAPGLNDIINPENPATTPIYA